MQLLFEFLRDKIYKIFRLSMLDHPVVKNILTMLEHQERIP